MSHDECEHCLSRFFPHAFDPFSLKLLYTKRFTIHAHDLAVTAHVSCCRGFDSRCEYGFSGREPGQHCRFDPRDSRMHLGESRVAAGL